MDVQCAHRKICATNGTLLIRSEPCINTRFLVVAASIRGNFHASHACERTAYSEILSPTKASVRLSPPALLCAKRRIVQAGFERIRERILCAQKPETDCSSECMK